MKLIRMIVHSLMAFMPKAIRSKMMSCEEAAHLLANQKNPSLKLKMHVALCECCHSYSKQLSFIHNHLKSLPTAEITKEHVQKIKFDKLDIIKKYSK